LSNVKMIVEVTLFPGIVTVVGGVVVTLPVPSITVHVIPAKLTLFKFKALFAGPPLREFQVAWIFRTVINSCGLVIVMLMVELPVVTMIGPAEIMLHPGTAVGVAVGVNVTVGVNVIVGVEVIVGVVVGVFVGTGVGVEPPSTTVGVLVGSVAVAVNVLAGTVAVCVGGTVAVGVLDEPDPEPDPDPEPTPEPEIAPDSTSTYPKIVRELIEVISRSARGTRSIKGL
jgi:hypothetical protein